MKECEKWAGCHGITLQEISAFRKGWRAALERFRNELGCSVDDEILRDIIEKELEG